MDPNLFRLDWERTAEVLAADALEFFVSNRAKKPAEKNSKYHAEATS